MSDTRKPDLIFDQRHEFKDAAAIVDFALGKRR